MQGNYKWLENVLTGIQKQLVKANHLKRLEIETHLLIKEDIDHRQIILTEFSEIMQNE